jgi:DNA polymerase (family X)
MEATVKRLARIIGRGRAGYRTAREFARRGARTRADLKRPEFFTRLPRESQANVLYATRRMPLAVAERVGAELRRRTRAEIHGRLVRLSLIPVGSVRRKEPTAGDLDFLVVAPADVALDEVLGRVSLAGAGTLSIADTFLSGERRRSFVLRYTRGGVARYIKTDLFLTTAEEKPYALFHYTGPTSYNIRTRAHAKRQGWKLNQYGLFDSVTGRRVRGSAGLRTEREVARLVGVTYRAPQNRSD